MASGLGRTCVMRERGRKYAFWARLGLCGSAAFLTSGLIAVSSHSNAGGWQNWIRNVGELVVAPAEARSDRRNNRGRRDDRSPEAALKQTQQQTQQVDAARRNLQEAEAAQRRIQQLQETVAAQQRRLEQLQQMEAAQRKQTPIQQPTDLAQRRQRHQDPNRPQGAQPATPQPSPGTQAPSPKLTGADRHRAALEETMAKLKGRHHAPTQERTRQEPPGHRAVSQHQAVLENAMAKLRGRQHSPRQDADRSSRDKSSAGRHHQAVLDQVTSRLRRSASRHDDRSDRRDDRSSRTAFGDDRGHAAQRHARDRSQGDHDRGGRDRDRDDWSRDGRNGSRHHAVYSQIRERLSLHRRQRRERDEPAPAAAPTPPPAVAAAPPAPPKTTTTAPKSTSSGLLPTAPNVRDVAPTIVSKLPEVATKTASADTSTSDNGMSRLGGPKQAADDKESGRGKTAKKDSDDAGDDAGNAKTGMREIGRRVTGALLPPPEMFRPNEVLAINLPAAGLARALERNFSVLEQVDYPALGFKVTRLATPDNQNALIGRGALHEALPNEGFGLNHIYAAGRTSSNGPVPSGVDAAPPGNSAVKSAAVSSTPAANANVPRRAGTGACTSDRCFGVSVINWRPQLATCARGIKIGVIDTGVDSTHPAFENVRFEHQDFVPKGKKKPSNQHGTGVFSLMAGNPGSSTPGLVPDARFYVGDAFFADRNGNAMSDTMTMLKALDWLKKARVDIANLSFAGPSDELVHEAIRDLARTGTVVLAAAGNEGQDAPPSYPAGYEEVVAVTAVDRNLAPYAYANRGKYIDVAAPGVDVWTALPNRREGPQTGTSFAVPFVASVVALTYRSEDREGRADPLAPKARALALLQQNIKVIGGRGQTSVFGAGLVQAPSHCDPRGPSTVASGGWAGTVHPVANHK